MRRASALSAIFAAVARHATLRVSTMDGIVEKVHFGLPEELETETPGHGGRSGAGACVAGGAAGDRQVS